MVAGDRIEWKSVNNGGLTYASGRGYGFIGTAIYKVSGNLASLCYGDNFIGQTELPASNIFCYLFDNDSSKDNLMSVKNLFLPFHEIKNGCYKNMFYGVVNITEIPDLSQITFVRQNGCLSMFSLCTNLTGKAELSAIIPTQLSACNSMFSGTKITSVSDLNAGEGNYSSYWSNAFTNCRSLVEIGNIYGTICPQNAFNNAFKNCTSLVHTGNIYLTGFRNSAFYYAFSGCSSLVYPPEFVGAESLSFYDNSEFSHMFSQCTSLVKGPDLTSRNIGTTSYEYMFSGCTSLSYLKCLLNTPGSNNANMLSSVSDTGTLVAKSGADWTSLTVAQGGAPSTWTIEYI